MTDVPPLTPSPSPRLNGRVIVQAERATRAVLDVHLAAHDTSFRTWIPLNLVATDPGSTIESLVDQLVVGLRVDQSQARQAVDDLADAGLVTVTDTVRLTEAGRATHQRINVGITELTRRLYDGLAHDDLVAARRVLEALTERARAELALAS
jgi:DNA-binding MarR family transcriptional regulator